MVTTELVKEIASREGMTQADTSKVIKGALEVIKEKLAEGDFVRIADFGTFTKQAKAARKGHNPRTGEEIDIPAHNKVKFTEAKALKEAVNQ